MSVGAGLTAQAQNVLDFQSLQSTGTGFTNVGPQYAEDGFTLDVPTSETSSDFRAAQTGNTGSFANSTGLAITSVGNTARLSRQGGGTFRITSIQLSELFTSTTPATPARTVTFTGFFAAGGSTTQTFILDESFGFQTFSFNSAFTNLAFVDFGAQTALGYQFDNVRVTPLAAVPEPATLMLVGISLVGAAAGVIKRRRDGDVLE